MITLLPIGDLTSTYSINNKYVDSGSGVAKDFASYNPPKMDLT